MRRAPPALVSAWVPGLALALTAAPARAQSAAPTVQDARADLERYVTTEYVFNGLFVAVGAANLGAAGWLLTQDAPFARGVGYPLAVVGAVQLLAGAIYLGITPGFYSHAARELSTDPAGYQRDEGRRFAGVMGAFPWFLTVDAALIVAGAVVLGAGRAQGDDLATGVGVGCLGSGLIEFAIDGTTLLLEHRHLAVTRRFRLTVGPSSLGLAGTF